MSPNWKKDEDTFFLDSEEYWTGSFNDFLYKMDREWWEETDKRIGQLSKRMDEDIREHLPTETNRKLFGEKSPQEFDEENTFSFKTYRGKTIQIMSSCRLFKVFEKTTGRVYEETYEAVKQIGIDPKGTTLPKYYNPDFFTKYKGFFGKPYSYRVGGSPGYRIVWKYIEHKKNVPRQVLQLKPPFVWIENYGNADKIHKQYSRLR